MAEANDEGAEWPLGRKLTCPFTGGRDVDLRVRWGRPNLYQLRSPGLDRPYTFTEEAWIVLGWFYRRDEPHLMAIRRFVESIERKPRWPADTPRLGLFRFAKLFPDEYAGFQPTGMWEEEMWEEHGESGLRGEAITIEHRRIVNAFFERAGLPPPENLTEAAQFFDAAGPVMARFDDGSTFSDGTGFVGSGAEYAASLAPSDGDGVWDEGDWDATDWADRPQLANQGYGRGGYGSGRYGMPLDEAAPIPQVPPQGPGPKFEVGDDGRVHLAKPSALPEGANRQRLEQTHPELIDAARRLVEKLQGSNTHPELLDAARRYLAAVDRPLSELQFMIVAGRGLLLGQQLTAAQHGDTLAPALDPAAAAAVRGVLTFHRPFVMAVPEAREFLEDAAEPHLTEQFAQLEPHLRKIARAFARDDAIGDPETREAVATLGAPPLGGASAQVRRFGVWAVDNTIKAVALAAKAAVAGFGGTIGKAAADRALEHIGPAARFILEQASTLYRMATKAPDQYGWLQPVVAWLRRIAEGGD